MERPPFSQFMSTEFGKARDFTKRFLSEKSVELSFIFGVLVLVYIITTLTLRIVSIWKVRQYRTNNWLIFFGQLFLIAGLWCAVKSIESFHIKLIHSFLLSSAACYFFSGCVFLSYDFKRPPSQPLGISLCVLAVGSCTACLYSEYNKLWDQFTAMSSVISLNVFAIGISFITLNVLGSEYKRCHSAFWNACFQRQMQGELS